MACEEWYTINNAEQLDTPALVVYPARVAYNISLIKSMIDDVGRLRPHVKTHKSPDVTRLMLQAGITKFKCATIAEAEMLGLCGAPDVLLAYQPVGPKLNRFVQLIKTYPQTKFSCLIDDNETARAISAKGVEYNIRINIFIDLNIGMDRTGVAPGNKAMDLYDACAKMPGIIIKGLHAYDGHIHDHHYEVRRQKSDESLQPVLQLALAITSKGYPALVIIAGGSPAFPIIAQREHIECSPGTFTYWDRGYQLAYKEQKFETAALIIARIVSLPCETTICIDAGHKSVSAENELAKRIYFLNAPGLIFISQSEEHLVAEAGKGHRYKIGDILYGLPYHICPSVALYERAVTIVNNHIAGEWMNLARDRKINL